MSWFRAAALRADSPTRSPVTIYERDIRSYASEIGISLSPEMARGVKAEAARRGISLRKLFEELWTQYQKSAPAKSKP